MMISAAMDCFPYLVQIHLHSVSQFLEFFRKEAPCCICNHSLDVLQPLCAQNSSCMRRKVGEALNEEGFHVQMLGEATGYVSGMMHATKLVPIPFAGWRCNLNPILPPYPPTSSPAQIPAPQSFFSQEKAQHHSLGMSVKHGFLPSSANSFL